MNAQRTWCKLSKGILAIAALPAAALAADIDDCGGWLSVYAQILRIEPVGAMATKVLPSGKEVSVGAESRICEGETLDLRSGAVTKVTLFSNGKQSSIQAPARLVAPARMAVLAQAVTSWMGRVISTFPQLRQPDQVPKGTHGRGGSVAALPIRANLNFPQRPKYAVTEGATVLLSWREGGGPYHCETIDDSGKRLWQSQPEDAGTWCRLTPMTGDQRQVAVRGGNGRAVLWNVELANWAEVPRPPELNGQEQPRSPAEAVLWGWWLWKNGGERWRMQALSMMDAHANQVFVAGLLVNQILAESADVAP